MVYKTVWRHTTFRFPEEETIRRLQVQSKRLFSLGKNGVLRVKKTEETEAWLDDVAKEIFECPIRNPEEKKRTYERVRRDVSYMVPEKMICEALGAKFLSKTTVDFNDVNEYGFDVIDPVTGFKLEIKKTNGWDRFSYRADAISACSSATLKGAVDFVVAIGMEDLGDSYELIIKMVLDSYALFMLGDVEDGMLLYKDFTVYRAPNYIAKNEHWLANYYVQHKIDKEARLNGKT